MYNKSTICKTANALIREGRNRSDAFKVAWKLAKGLETKVAGVSFGKRPAALERLTHYPAELVQVRLIPEEGNPYDAGAVQVMAAVDGKGRYCVGYVPRELAAALRPLVDAVRIRGYEIVGGWMYGLNYGLRLKLAV
jgi:hypothetical protein